jgi:hypothetical protein
MKMMMISCTVLLLLGALRLAQISIPILTNNTIQELQDRVEAQKGLIATLTTTATTQDKQITVLLSKLSEELLRNARDGVYSDDNITMTGIHCDEYGNCRKEYLYKNIITPVRYPTKTTMKAIPVAKTVE